MLTFSIESFPQYAQYFGFLTVEIPTN